MQLLNKGAAIGDCRLKLQRSMVKWLQLYFFATQATPGAIHGRALPEGGAMSGWFGSPAFDQTGRAILDPWPSGKSGNFILAVELNVRACRFGVQK